MSTEPITPELALENELPPEAAGWTPNEKIARLSKQSQQPTTYPIPVPEPKPAPEPPPA